MTTPPNSPNQPEVEIKLRGHDYAQSSTNDEYLRATRYRDQLKKRGQFRIALIKALHGDAAKRQTLNNNWMPVSESAPPYVEGQ